MTRKLFAILFAFCALSLVAQETIKVNYKGAKPTITDFANALFGDSEEVEGEAEGAMANAWENYCKGLPQAEGVTFTVDVRNGYICYDCRGDGYRQKMELCYWNEADQQHKLVAFNVSSFDERGFSCLGQYDGINFYRYNNATKKMTYYYNSGLDTAAPAKDGEWHTYNLPQTGKNIVVTSWNEDGPQTQFPVKWNGHKFVK